MKIKIKLNNMSVPNYPLTIAPTPRQIALAVSGVLLVLVICYLVTCFSYVNDSQPSVTTLNITQGMLGFNESTASISGRLAVEVVVIGDPRVITTPNYAELSIEMNLNGTKAVTVASSCGRRPTHQSRPSASYCSPVACSVVRRSCRA